MEREGVLNEDGTRDDPTLEKFEAHIAEVHGVETSVQAMPSMVMQGLLRINTQPLKQALVVLVSKWIFLYTQSLQQRVRCCHEIPGHLSKWLLLLRSLNFLEQGWQEA
jgi:hypothetical protein